MAAAALAAQVAGVAVLVVSAAAAPSYLSPSSSYAFPDWFAGPLHGIGRTLTVAQFVLLLAGLIVVWLVIVGLARVIELRWLLVAVGLTYAVVAIGPPLLSTDPFTYLDYARLGVLHGVNPYDHGPIAAPGDAFFHYAGWHTTASAYGPLFTLLTYALVPLGVGASLWGLKLLAAASCFALVLVVARAARRLGRDPVTAAAFVGLNPVVVVFALGGAHNDLLMLLLVTVGLLLLVERREASAGAAVVAGAAVKFSALAAFPFLVLGAQRRGRALAGAAGALVAFGALSVAFFGRHALGFIPVIIKVGRGAVPESIPAWISELFGHSGVSDEVRVITLVAMAVVILYLLLRTWRGADWIAMAGWAMLAVAAASTIFLAWYAIWALPFAALSSDRRLKVAAVGFGIYFIAADVAARLPL